MTHSFPTRRSSDLGLAADVEQVGAVVEQLQAVTHGAVGAGVRSPVAEGVGGDVDDAHHPGAPEAGEAAQDRSEEHTSELQSLMRISYAVFCLKKKNNTNSDIKTE